MSRSKNINVVDFKSLELEKNRLKAVCAEKKVILDNKLDFLKRNYPEVAVKTLLPFNDATNDAIFSSARLIHHVASDYFSKTDSKLASFISGKGKNALEALLIYTAIRLGKNFIEKHK